MAANKLRSVHISLSALIEEDTTKTGDEVCKVNCPICGVDHLLYMQQARTCSKAGKVCKNFTYSILSAHMHTHTDTHTINIYAKHWSLTNFILKATFNSIGY